MDSRAVAPVVGKLLAAVIAMLYVAGATTLLLGGIVPEYRTAAGEELSGRVLADAAGSVERAVPDSDAAVDGRLQTDLPATIRDAGYTLALQNGTLALDHPEHRLDARTNLSLPPSVHTVDSRWESGEVLVVRVSGDGTNRTVALEER